eukprot:COSAG06_NODE_1831_length_8265_cov_5.188219_1_plen_286_part_00
MVWRNRRMLHRMLVRHGARVGRGTHPALFPKTRGRATPSTKPLDSGIRPGCERAALAPQVQTKRGDELTTEERRDIEQRCHDQWQKVGQAPPSDSPVGFETVPFGHGQPDGLTDNLSGGALWFFTTDEHGAVVDSVRLVGPGTIELKLYEDRLCPAVQAVLNSADYNLVEINRAAPTTRRGAVRLMHAVLDHIAGTCATLICGTADASLLRQLRKLERKKAVTRVGEPFKYGDEDPDEARVYISTPSQLQRWCELCGVLPQDHEAAAPKKDIFFETARRPPAHQE